jgi:plasmid stability protein
MKTKMLTIRLPTTLHRKLRHRCVEHDETVAEFARRVITAALDAEDHSQPERNPQ